MDRFEEFINKQHTTLEDVLNDLTEDSFFNIMLGEAIREDALENSLDRFQQRLHQFDLNKTPSGQNPGAGMFGGPQSTPNMNPNNSQQTQDPFSGGQQQPPTADPFGGNNPQPQQTQDPFSGGQQPPAAGEQNPFAEDPFSQTPQEQQPLDANTDPFSGGDVFSGGGENPTTAEDPFAAGGDDPFADLSGGGDMGDGNPFGGEEENELSSDLNPEQNIEDQKDRLISNVKQLMELRDLLDEVISTTSDPKFLKINQQVNKLLSSIASAGDTIMDRQDLHDLNNEMEQFLTDAVEESKQKIDEIKAKEQEKKREASA